MNQNKIEYDKFSNPDSAAMYRDQWLTEYGTRKKYESGLQCGGCSFYAPFNTDWGLCCHPRSRHRFETTFEHFTCPSHVNEGWQHHSFDDDPNYHCKCEKGINIMMVQPGDIPGT